MRHISKSLIASLEVWAKSAKCDVNFVSVMLYLSIIFNKSMSIIKLQSTTPTCSDFTELYVEFIVIKLERIINMYQYFYEEI